MMIYTKSIVIQQESFGKCWEAL